MGQTSRCVCIRMDRGTLMCSLCSLLFQPQIDVMEPERAFSSFPCFDLQFDPAPEEEHAELWLLLPHCSFSSFPSFLALPLIPQRPLMNLLSWPCWVLALRLWIGPCPTTCTTALTTSTSSKPSWCVVRSSQSLSMVSVCSSCTRLAAVWLPVKS